MVITDQPCRWDILEWYGRRFWIETGFRSDKEKGWHWEDSQVQDVYHNDRLLTAMAWASLLMFCLGAQEAKARQQRAEHRATNAKARNRRPARPEHARQSLFTMGLRRVRAWLYGTARSPIQWLLPAIDAVSWNWRWLQFQSNLFLFETVRP